MAQSARRRGNLKLKHHYETENIKSQHTGGNVEGGESQKNSIPLGEESAAWWRDNPKSVRAHIDGGRLVTQEQEGKQWARGKYNNPQENS